MSISFWYIDRVSLCLFVCLLACLQEEWDSGAEGEILEERQSTIKTIATHSSCTEWLRTFIRALGSSNHSCLRG